MLNLYADHKKLMEQKEYSEPFGSGTNIVYMGKHSNNATSHFRGDQLLKPLRIPENVGKVLMPKVLGSQWSYLKNQAFWAGAMVAGKSFLLVTPISNYTKSNFVTGTIDEILWLLDNGYQASKDGDKILFKPTREITTPKIYHYNNGAGPDDDEQIGPNMINRVREIENQLGIAPPSAHGKPELRWRPVRSNNKQRSNKRQWSQPSDKPWKKSRQNRGC